VWGCSITLLLLALLLHFTAAFYYTFREHVLSKGVVKCSSFTTPKREHSAYSLGAQGGLLYYFTTTCFTTRFTALHFTAEFYC
jgi:hypothetical protein